MKIISLLAPALCFGEFDKCAYHHNIYLNIPQSLAHFVGFYLSSIGDFFTKNKKDKAIVSLKELRARVFIANMSMQL